MNPQTDKQEENLSVRRHMVQLAFQTERDRKRSWIKSLCVTFKKKFFYSFQMCNISSQPCLKYKRFYVRTKFFIRKRRNDQPWTVRIVTLIYSS